MTSYSMTHYSHNLASAFTSTAPLSLKASEQAIMSVFEHQRLTLADFAQPSDFEWLLAQEFAVFTIKRQRGQWQLKVEHYIGVIILPSGITLEILPKTVAGVKTTSALPYDEVMLTRQWVQRMLSDLLDSSTNHQKPPHSQNLGQLSPHLTSLSDQPLTLSQWLVRQFVPLLAIYQPSQSYQTQKGNQTALQGKLLIKEQLLNNHHQPYKFACEINQLSPQTLANRLIKSALTLIEPLITAYQIRDPSALLFAAKLHLAPWQYITVLNRYERQRLKALYLQAKQQLIVQPMSRRQYHAAQQLLDLAYWLLQMQHSSLPTGHGLDLQKSQLRLCLLINMPQAFEQWASLRIGAMFTQISAKYTAWYQSQRIWLTDSSGQAQLSIRPDLLISHSADRSHGTNEHYSHVIDIKWKPLAQAREISASDAYQLTSYAQAYQAEQVWLVYPVTDDTHQPVALRQMNPAGASQKSKSPFKLIQHATLWLVPFNVTTAKLNSWPKG